MGLPPTRGAMARATVDPHGNRFYNEDCVEGARRHLADRSVDLIVTDPPYGIEGDRLHRHYNRKESFVVEGYVDVPQKDYADFSRRWIAEAARVLRPGGAIYVVSGYTNLPAILGALRGAGLEEINHIVWKYSFGVFTRNKFVSSHYHILYYAKPGGERTFHTESRFGLAEKGSEGGSLNYDDREDVWVIGREYKPGRVKNKNELPTELLVKMIQYSSSEGDLVADLFLGGFSTAKAAIGLNRRFVGFEVSQPIFERKIREMRHLIPGNLLPQLRIPRVEPRARQGERWTAAEAVALLERFRELRETRSKREAIAVLSKELGRGRWALEKRLVALGDSARSPRAPLPRFR